MGRRAHAAAFGASQRAASWPRPGLGEQRSGSRGRTARRRCVPGLRCALRSRWRGSAGREVPWLRRRAAPSLRLAAQGHGTRGAACVASPCLTAPDLLACGCACGWARLSAPLLTALSAPRSTSVEGPQLACSRPGAATDQAAATRRWAAPAPAPTSAAPDPAPQPGLAGNRMVWAPSNTVSAQRPDPTLPPPPPPPPPRCRPSRPPRRPPPLVPRRPAAAASGSRRTTPCSTARPRPRPSSAPRPPRWETLPRQERQAGRLPCASLCMQRPHLRTPSHLRPPPPPLALPPEAPPWRPTR
jgi:hypothetical protein